MTKKNHIRDLKISGVLAGRRLITEGWYWGRRGANVSELLGSWI